MGTFFSRKYMRGQPQRTERLVGVSVLVLLGLIVACFLLTGGLFAGVIERVSLLRNTKNLIGISERPLFVAAPENASPAAPPHEMRQAVAMLPLLPAPWERTSVNALPVRSSTQPSAEDSAGTEAKFWAVLDQFGATWVYRGRYRLADQHVDVRIADAASPDSAFGIWRALTPQEGEHIAIGREGWRTKTAFGFWAGRYYTELVGQPGTEAQTLETVARAVGSIQLAYGGPFWADAVLPKEQRIEKSFRYVRKEPLGVSELSDCWLVDYQTGHTVGVMQSASPQKILDALRTRLADAGQEAGEHGGADSIPHLPEALAAALVHGHIGERLLVAFEAGPHLFVVTGKEPDALGTLAKTLYDRWSGGAVQLAGAVGQAQEHSQPSVAGSAQFAEVGGDLVPPPRIERYTDNLYEKIDGREGQFRAFHFVELRFGQYVDMRQKQTFDVYIYDMAEPVNAMGIYMSERSGEAAVVEVGREGYESGGSVYYWKGKYYVNVLAPADSGETGVANSKKIAEAIADSIADAKETFWAETLLPEPDRVPNSFKYRATSALGYDFLEGVYLADYQTADKKYTMFVMRAASPANARELFEKLAQVAAKYDKVLSREATPGGEKILSDSLGVFACLFAEGTFLGGVVECDDQKLAVERAEMLRERIQKEGGAIAATSQPANEKPASTEPPAKTEEPAGEY